MIAGLGFWWALAGIATAADSGEFAFVVNIDRQAAEKAAALAGQSGDTAQSGGAFSGRLYVFLSQREGGEPRFGPNWFQPQPFFRQDVTGARAGKPMRVDDSAAGFPDSLAKLPAGKYRVQAILAHNPDYQNHALGVGNLYSEVVSLDYKPGASKPLELLLDRVVEPREFAADERLREVVLASPLLTKFHGRPVVERVAVLLPEGYDDEPQRRYPVEYRIPGFGGSHRDALRSRGGELVEGEEPFIRVFLSGQCEWGHHVYADSATNGPRGAALVQELVPYIDATFRTVAAPTARFVTGHSSGGWSSLWLQVNYPETFGGCWSTAPDPVDFRDFQRIDLYADPPSNFYREASGERRPLARRGGGPALWFDSFTKMDDTLGRGGQLRSFEAVFSPLGPDGQPRRAWNRETGAVDPEVAQAWKAYDIRLLLEERWSELAPKLRGKLHIITGDEDTFYLEGAVKLLAQSLEQLRSDAVVEVVPGKNHSNLLNRELRERIRREMSGAFRAAHPKAARLPASPAAR